MFAFIFHGLRSQLETTRYHQPEQRALSLDATPTPPCSTPFERSFSTSTFSMNFLSQTRVPSIKIEKFGFDELIYLEAQSSFEGPPSQRIFSRIHWKVKAVTSFLDLNLDDKSFGGDQFISENSPRFD